MRNISEEELVKYASINIDYLRVAYAKYPEKDKFFNPFFENLCGTALLRKQIISGISADSIRATWQPALKGFKEIRKKYLMYEDFE